MGKIVLICLSAVYGFIYLVLAAKTGRPIRTILLYALVGLGAMALINLTTHFSGVSIPVNAYTVGVNAALGLPGTVGLLFTRLIFL